MLENRDHEKTIIIIITIVSLNIYIYNLVDLAAAQIQWTSYIHVVRHKHYCKNISRTRSLLRREYARRRSLSRT